MYTVSYSQSVKLFVLILYLQEFEDELLFETVASLLVQNSTTSSQFKSDKMAAVMNLCFVIVTKACENIDVTSQKAILSSNSKQGFLTQFSVRINVFNKCL